MSKQEEETSEGGRKADDRLKRGQRVVSEDDVTIIHNQGQRDGRWVRSEGVGVGGREKSRRRVNRR